MVFPSFSLSPIFSFIVGGPLVTPQIATGFTALAFFSDESKPLVTPQIATGFTTPIRAAAVVSPLVTPQIATGFTRNLA